jgi:hypothetical protein
MKRIDLAKLERRKVMNVRSIVRSCLMVAAVSGLATSASAGVIITDDFEIDSSANYTVVNDGSPDGTVDFMFDYVAAGIPLAPNSSPGDTYGVRFTANDTAGATDAFTAFHNTLVTGNYMMQVDVYMGVTGTGGTTEYAHVGVGGDGVTFNQVFSPISGSGSFLAFTGDGGSSSSDYRWFNEEITTVPTDDPSYLAGSGQNTAPLYQQIFPATNGSPTNIWTTVTITVDADTDTITYALDGTDIILGTTAFTDGQVSMGYADVFTSIANPFQSQFGIYDNLLVIPEPASLVMLAFGSAVVLLRRR